MAESYVVNKIRTAIQAARLQGLCYEAAMTFRQSLTKSPKEPLSRDDALALSNLVKSWDTARDAVRIAKGKPLPGSLRPKAKERKRNPNRAGQANGHAEPQGPAQPEPLAKPIPEPTENSSTQESP